jgi:hypothetical protein
MNNTPGANPSMYQPAGLPNLAPAATFQNTMPPEPASLTSSFRLQQGPQTTSFINQNPNPPEYQHSSPIPPTQTSQPGSFSRSDNGRPGSPIHRSTSATARTVELRPQPPRPDAPFTQFTDHMRPQLEADNYPPDQIDNRIDQEWRDLSNENKSLWEKRYAEQMKEYTQEMDVWKREQKKANNSVAGVSFSESRNRT